MQWTCPHCGMKTDAADGVVYQTWVCPHCGKTVNSPSGGDVVPKRSGKPWLDLSWRSWRNGLLFVLFLISIDVFYTLSSLFLPLVQAAREAARRSQCSQNLKQIGAAMQAYNQKYGCFPPAFIPDVNGKPKHSWRVLILPFLKQEALYREYRFDEPWNGPHNMELAQRMPKVYRCPTEGNPDFSQTSYAMIVGPHAFSGGLTARKMGDIKDGLSTTIMVAECADAGINWLAPRDLDAEKITVPHADFRDGKKLSSGIDSLHPSMLSFALFCDGEVRIIRRSVSEKVLKAMLTIDGGETIDLSTITESP
jgi:hypothetical protein